MIRFNGNYDDAITNFSQEDLDVFKDTYSMRYSLYSSSIDVLEKIFFKTLKDMNLQNKVILQRIEENGTVNNITLNSDGSISAIPCP